MPEIMMKNLEAFQEAITTHPRIMLFKHSPRCPISLAALDEWVRFRGQHPGATTLFVDVVADRALARGLAEACGVPHASPQAILFSDGTAVWDASHSAITAASLAGAWEPD
jgi:bacillithiol system protein YtxJ